MTKSASCSGVMWEWPCRTTSISCFPTTTGFSGRVMSSTQVTQNSLNLQSIRGKMLEVGWRAETSRETRPAGGVVVQPGLPPDHGVELLLVSLIVDIFTCGPG